MRKSLNFILIASLVAMLSSCNKEDADKRYISNLAPGVYIGEGKEALTNLPPNAVLLRVNGFSFTRHDFDVDQDVYGKMMSFLRNGKIDANSSDMRKLQYIRSPKVLNTVLRRELFNQEAHRRGIKVSDAAKSYRRRELENAIRANSMETNKTVTIEELAEQMGPECGKYFLGNLAKDAENLELTWNVGGQKVQVSEDDVTAGSNRLAQANALVTTTNSILTARLQKALERIKGGEDFAKVGAELSMFEKGEAKDWGTFSIENFESTDYPDMAEFLKKNPKPGTVAGPFQCDDGVSIVKVLSVEKGEKKENDEDDAADTTRFRLARISVETFEMHKSFSRAEIRKILEDKKRQRFEAQFGQQLFAAAVIEFPCGTNLFAAAESADRPKGDLKEKPRKTYKGEGEDVK